MSVITRIFDPIDPRLGRHVHHDSRSFDFRFPWDKPTQTNSLWTSSTGPLNQGQVGSCTGNATADWLNTDFADEVRLNYHGNAFLTEADALAIYGLATKLADPASFYPPNDTGSDGVHVAEAAEQLGYVDTYAHTFSFAALQAALEITPVIIGTTWTKTMFNPVNGLVSVGALTDDNIAGGHEYLGAGIDWAAQQIICRNSWGDQDAWPGCKPGGYFAVGFADFERLLADQGDVTVLHGKGLPVLAS